MAERIPVKLGKYKVIHEIGRGSMGVVYLGHDPYSDRTVALKVALSESLDDTETGSRYRKMFFNEAHTAGMLQHPNIVRVYDAGEEDETLYIVMEYVSGGMTLKHHTNVDNLLSIDKVVEIVFKCAKALDYAHRQGIVHRDIKPGNILLTEEGNVKIADFSIAHLAMTDSDNTHTQPIGFLGSPRYMSPEQVQEDFVTNQTDLFSLGVIMYELLCGHHPFVANSFSTLINKIINEDPPLVREHRKDLPKVLQTIVRHSLEKDLERRYHSGLDIAADLSLAFSHLERPAEDLGLKERYNSIKELDFFEGFPQEELWEVVNAGIWQEYDGGDRIISEGEFEDSFYIILSGSVEVHKGDNHVGTLHAGDCFGEMGYLAKAKRTATIIAVAKVSLLKVNATLMEQASITCQLRFSKVFLRTLIDRLSRTTEMISSLAG